MHYEIVCRQIYTKYSYPDMLPVISHKQHYFYMYICASAHTLFAMTSLPCDVRYVVCGMRWALGCMAVCFFLSLVLCARARAVVVRARGVQLLFHCIPHIFKGDCASTSTYYKYYATALLLKKICCMCMHFFSLSSIYLCIPGVGPWVVPPPRT